MAGHWLAKKGSRDGWFVLRRYDSQGEATAECDKLNAEEDAAEKLRTGVATLRKRLEETRVDCQEQATEAQHDNDRASYGFHSGMAEGVKLATGSRRARLRPLMLALGSQSRIAERDARERLAGFSGISNLEDCIMTQVIIEKTDAVKLAEEVAVTVGRDWAARFLEIKLHLGIGLGYLIQYETNENWQIPVIAWRLQSQETYTSVFGLGAEKSEDPIASAGLTLDELRVELTARAEDAFQDLWEYVAEQRKGLTA